MRPLRLTMTAFGPYAGTEVVDFDSLTELGLFVVAGNNGSGKTTIFDALHYSLFGTLPGRRATYVRLRSDHAEAAVECSVALDFAAHGKHWRVERSPKQKRPKRRGGGMTEVDRRATLFRLDQGVTGPAVAVANKIGQVDQRCRELVGLSGKQFERVALLPQGEFSRVLRESSTERRELLRTLFSSEIFGDATSLLTDQAAQATSADQSAIERLDDRRQAVASQLSEMIGESVTGSELDLLDTIVRFRQHHVATLEGNVAAGEQRAATTTKAHQAGLEVAQRVARRDHVGAAVASHTAALAQHERDIARLADARAAVPVASQARAHSQQEQRLRNARSHVEQLTDQINGMLRVVGLAQLTTIESSNIAAATDAVTAIADQLEHRRVGAHAVSDLDGGVKRLQADLRRRGNEIATLNEQMRVAESQHRQLTNEQAELVAAPSIEQCELELTESTTTFGQRRELADLHADYATATEQAEELDGRIEQLTVAVSAAHDAHVALTNLQLRAQDAIDALEEANRRRVAAHTFASATARLMQVRADHETARAFADRQWDAFIAGTAVRVAEALVDGEPCPVCGSDEHPAAAQAGAGDAVATESDVLHARSRVTELQAEVSQVESQIEGLRAVDTDIAELSTVELEAQISTAKAMALGARTAADEGRAAAAQVEPLTRQLDEAMLTKQNRHEERRFMEQRRHELRGALGAHADAPLHIAHDRADAAHQARAAAEHTTGRLSELTGQIEAAAQTIDTIGLSQIAAENRRASVSDQLDQQQARLATAHDQLAAIDADIAAVTQDSTSNHSPDQPGYEQRSQAARHVLQALGELNTAVALSVDALDGQRRAQSILQERLDQSPFAAVDAAREAFMAPELIAQLEAQVTQFATTGDRLQGQLHELADVPDHAPDIAVLAERAEQAVRQHALMNRQLITMVSHLNRFETELQAIASERQTRADSDTATRRLERVAALVKGDNERNTSLENWVLAAHLRDVVELANVRLAQSTHQRFQLCVLDDGENRRGKWGLDLGVEDTVTGTRRPTAGLSGGELFQASLALALGLADAVMNQSAGVRIDALFIDEGFGSLDETSVERAIDLLDELRDRGAMVGVITHVPALLEALPRGITVVDAPDGQGSTIHQERLAA